jgi:molecular chaperone GrpE
MTDKPKAYSTVEDVSIAASNEGRSHEAAATTAAESSVSMLGALQAELAEAKDRALRAHAETENVRKRMRREMDDERKYAEQTLLFDLLPVIDNLGRALTAAEKNAETGGLSAGVKMVAQQLETVLAKHHCSRIEALGKPFDPNFHAAIQQQPTADQPPNTVVFVAQEGYKVHDRVLRPSQVIVSSAPADQQAQQQ